jgi:four helix bundle protein
MNENIVLRKSFDFALEIISYTEVLQQKMKFVMTKQLLRCGTSIGANVHEAQRRKQTGLYTQID